MQTQHAPIISSVILSGVSILPTLVLLGKILHQTLSGHIRQEVILWMDVRYFFGKIGVLLRDLESQDLEHDLC